MRPTAEQFGVANGITPVEAKRKLRGMAGECPFAWSEIPAWLNRTEPSGEFRQKMVDDYVPPAPYNCAFCGKLMQWIYWENDVPLELLCNVDGMVEVCSDCEYWLRLKMLWVS